MNRNRILIPALALGFWLFLRRSGSEEEPSDFVDTPTIPTNPIGNVDISSHCVLNPATTAQTINFRLSEFHSKDGTQVPTAIRGNVQTLMQQLQVIRNYFRSQIIITSGYRSPEHNQNVGGSTTSMHLCGMAADLVVVGLSPNEVQEGIERLMSTGQIIDGGLGRYNTFTHYDIGRRRRWDKRG